MNEISFKQRIVLTTKTGYQRARRCIPEKNVINYPWRKEQSVLSESVASPFIKDCAFLGISDGQNVLGLHLNPLDPLNKMFSSITNFIKNKIDVKNPDLEAIVIGGKAPCIAGEDSYKQIDNIVKFLEDENIPYTLLKGGMGERDVCYSSQTDTWVIGTDTVNRLDPYRRGSAMDIFKEIFSEVKVSPKDEIFYQKTWF